MGGIAYSCLNHVPPFYLGHFANDFLTILVNLLTCNPSSSSFGASDDLQRLFLFFLCVD